MAKWQRFLYLFDPGKRNINISESKKFIFTLLNFNDKCTDPGCSPENQLRATPRKHKHPVQYNVSLIGTVSLSVCTLTPVCSLDVSVYQPVCSLFCYLDTHTVLATWPSSRVNTPAAAHSGHVKSYALG